MWANIRARNEISSNKMVQVFRETNGYSVKDLLQVAIDHLASAKVLFDKNPRCYDSAGYLSHLGIELVLKSFLLHFTGKFPGIHSLTELMEKVEACGPRLSLERNYRKILSHLDRFTDLRYPQPSHPIEIGDEDWKSIEALCNSLIGLMPGVMQRTIDYIEHEKKGKRILMRKRRNSS